MGISESDEEGGARDRNHTYKKSPSNGWGINEIDWIDVLTNVLFRLAWALRGGSN